MLAWRRWNGIRSSKLQARHGKAFLSESLRFKEAFFSRALSFESACTCDGEEPQNDHDESERVAELIHHRDVQNDEDDAQEGDQKVVAVSSALPVASRSERDRFDDHLNHEAHGQCARYGAKRYGVRQRFVPGYAQQQRVRKHEKGEDSAETRNGNERIYLPVPGDSKFLPKRPTS